MTRPSGWLIAALAACALVLVGCGADDGSTPPEGQGGDDAAASASPGIDLPDLTGQSVEIAGVWTGGEEQSFRKVAAAFEDATGATVVYTPTGDNIGAIVGTRVQGGRPPHVAFLPQPGLLADFAQQGALLPLDDVVSDLVDQHYRDVWRNLATVDDTLYGVFFKAAHKSPVWYDVADFDTAGVQPPETWQELLAAAGRLADAGLDPVAVAGGDGWTLTDWFENVYLRTAGPDLYDRLTAHEIAWTDDSVRHALEVLQQLWGDPRLLADDPLLTGYPDSVTKVFGVGGDAAIVYEADFTAGVIGGSTDAELGRDADLFLFPTIGEPVGPMPVIAAGNVAVMMQRSEAAEAFLRFVATPRAAEAWAADGGFLSPNKDVDPSVYPDDITRELAQQLVDADPLRFDLSDLQPAAFGATVGQGLYTYLQDLLGGIKTLDETVEALERAATQAYRNTYGQDTSPIGSAGGDGRGEEGAA